MTDFHKNRTTSKNMPNQIVCESITEALFKLMRKKDFADITITELTKSAGVGRVSFYRNYESKEDVLQQYMAQAGGDFWYSKHKEDPATLWRMTFEIFELLKPAVLLIHKSKIDHVLYDFIKKCTRITDAATNKEAYHRAMFAGLAFGLYDQWLSTGMKETPEELAAMFSEMILPYEPRPVIRE